MFFKTISSTARRVTTACCCLAIASTLIADDAKPSPDELIKQLDSDEFTERQAAAEKLTALGKAAIPALMKGALSKSLEPRRRSFALLSSLFKSSDDATKAAAKKALEELASGKDAKLAASAKKILEPPRPPQVFQGRGGAIQLNIQGIGANVQVSVSDANGVKTITVKENGVQAKIVKDQNGFHGELTKNDKNGKPQTTKVEAKDVDDLKKKSPELHGYFEKYGKGRAGLGGARIQIGQRIIGGGARRVVNPAQLLIPGLVDPKDIQGADDHLAKAITQLKALAKASDKPDSINEAIKSLEAARSSIEKMKQGSEMREFSKRMREAMQKRQQDLQRKIAP